jgi:hypothetical protein
LGLSPTCSEPCHHWHHGLRGSARQGRTQEASSGVSDGCRGRAATNALTHTAPRAPRHATAGAAGSTQGTGGAAGAGVYRWRRHGGGGGEWTWGHMQQRPGKVRGQSEGEGGGGVGGLGEDSLPGRTRPLPAQLHGPLWTGTLSAPLPAQPQGTRPAVLGTLTAAPGTWAQTRAGP